MRNAILAFALLSPVWGQARPDAMDQAFRRMYNFDFDAADRIIDSHIEANRQDHFAHAVRASSLLFRELDRLGILESEFFEDDDRIADKRKLKADAALRARLFGALGEAERLAGPKASGATPELRSMFTKAMALGIRTDYLAFVEKRQIGSLSYAKESQRWAAEILRRDPNYTDAYLTAGISEYLLGSLPFFVRWFVRFEDVAGDKAKAVSNLEKVATRGRYLGPFAKILLSLIDLREDNLGRAKLRLEGLVREYPENPLFRKELARISDLIHKKP